MDREGIYYWKCDRASAFHGTSDYLRDQRSLEASLERTLLRRFGVGVSEIRPGCGQGNHRTFIARLNGERVFVRVEDGPEGDGYFSVEKVVTDRVAALGLPVPKTLAYDVARASGFGICFSLVVILAPSISPATGRRGCADASCRSANAIAGRWPSRSVCRTARWPRPWRSTSSIRRRRLCRRMSSRSG